MWIIYTLVGVGIGLGIGSILNVMGRASRQSLDCESCKAMMDFEREQLADMKAYAHEARSAAALRAITDNERRASNN